MDIPISLEKESDNVLKGLMMNSFVVSGKK